ncbi:hypothetical protein F2P79_019958 [Pimephales promelas]|nr:hypothetical protein F2P79_019958 [Pimephales promelas]
MGTSMVRHVCATSGKDKVHTHCFPGTHVHDVAAQVPEILSSDEPVGAVVLHVGANDIRLSDPCGEMTRLLWAAGSALVEAVVLHTGANDIRLRQTEVLKEDYTSLIETVSSTSPEASIIVSGLLPMYRQGRERSRLYRADCFTPAESERLFCRTSPRRYTPDDYDCCGETTRKSPPGSASPLFESKCDDAMIIVMSVVRHVHATSGKGKVRTHCFPGAHVLDVASQVPEIMNGDHRVGSVVLNVGGNGIRLRRDLGCIVQMAFTPAESERLFCQKTSPRRYTPDDHWRDRPTQDRQSSLMSFTLSLSLMLLLPLL